MRARWAKAAPSASDVENLETGLEQQLGGNVLLLGKLRLLQRRVGVLKIGAGVLQVGIQEQPIDTIVDVVVVNRVAPRPPQGVVLKKRARDRAQDPQGIASHTPPRPAEVLDSEVQEIRDRALLDDDVAIHVKFAESQLGVDQDGALGCSRGEADRHRGTGLIAAGKAQSSRGRDLEIPDPDQPFEYRSKQPIHRPPPTPLRRPRRCHARDTISVHRR